jgi:putative peptidoglycan binding protein
MTFKQSPAGFVNIKGPLIQHIQAKLNEQGCNAGAVDGLWGRNTIDAIRSWQQTRQLPVTGIIDDNAWTGLTQTQVPALFQRCLQLTGAWEGTGYSGANGNFDGQGITWGVVGFTWGNGELQGFLQEIQRSYPATFTSAFGSLEPIMMGVLSQSLPA